MSYWDAGQSPRHPAACTPEQHQQEISAFSPDTTNDVVDNGYDMHYSFYSPGRDDREDEYIDTASMHSDGMSSTAVCEQSVLSNDSLERPRSPAKPDISPTTNVPLPKPQPSPGGSSMSEREQLEKWWDHEWTLDQLEHSVKDFPSNMLRLTSPVHVPAPKQRTGSPATVSTDLPCHFRESPRLSLREFDRSELCRLLIVDPEKHCLPIRCVVRLQLCSRQGLDNPGHPSPIRVADAH